MNVWVISDTHFYHDNIIKFENRPEDHTEQIIDNWRSVIQEKDLVIHLGDVIFGMNKQRTLPLIMERLPGKKVLTLGNHDNFPPTFYLNAGFDFVCDYFVLNTIAFSHAPLTPLPQGVTLNIHGHFHRGQHRGNEDAPPDRHYDYTYYSNNKSKYHLIQIEDTLSPFMLSDITSRFDIKKKA